MTIKVIPEDVLIKDDHSIKKSQLIKMINGYKDHPEGGKDDTGTLRELTRFAHFPVSRILELFVDNKIVSSDDTIADLLSNKTHGLKIYFSQHMDKDDCPVDFKNYVGRNTTVLVNTELNAEKKWDDMLDDGKESSSFVATSAFNSGTGSDRTELCPPQCGLFGKTL